VTRALVFGGSGTVGSAVVRELHAAGVDCELTYCTSSERAEALAEEVGGRTHHTDATDATSLKRLAADVGAVDAFIHCAAILDTRALADLDDDGFDESHAVNARSAFVLCRELAPHMAARGHGNILLVGGLDRAQSLPIPVAYAASQGTLAAMTMALAKELGPRGVSVNMVALGLLDAGLSLGLGDQLREDYLAYSALRRFGNPKEAAKAIAWLALHDHYLNGKVIPINGGL
jgi:NAD(P)-dependent dehydrogenase (short-subunit alcohol dehydrogenase family)